MKRGRRALSIQFAIIERIDCASGTQKPFSVNHVGSQVKINLLFTPFLGEMK
jgi:hypothetical protein